MADKPLLAAAADVINADDIGGFNNAPPLRTQYKWSVDKSGQPHVVTYTSLAKRRLETTGFVCVSFIVTSVIAVALFYGLGIALAARSHNSYCVNPGADPVIYPTNLSGLCQSLPQLGVASPYELYAIHDLFGSQLHRCMPGATGTNCDEVAIGNDYTVCPPNYQTLQNLANLSAMGVGFGRCVGSGVTWPPYTGPGAGANSYGTIQYGGVLFVAMVSADNVNTELTPVGNTVKLCTPNSCANGGYCMNDFRWPALDHDIYCSCPRPYRSPFCTTAELCRQKPFGTISSFSALVTGTNPIATSAVSANHTNPVYLLAAGANPALSQLIATWPLSMLLTGNGYVSGLSKNCFDGLCNVGGAGDCVCNTRRAGGGSGPACSLLYSPADAAYSPTQFATYVTNYGSLASNSQRPVADLTGFYRLLFTGADALRVGMFTGVRQYTMSIWSAATIAYMTSPATAPPPAGGAYNVQALVQCLRATNYRTPLTIAVVNAIMSQRAGVTPDYIVETKYIDPGAQYGNGIGEFYALRLAAASSGAPQAFRFQASRFTTGSTRLNLPNVLGVGINESFIANGETPSDTAEYIYIGPIATTDVPWALTTFSYYGGAAPSEPMFGSWELLTPVVVGQADSPCTVQPNLGAATASQNMLLPLTTSFLNSIGQPVLVWTTGGAPQPPGSLYPYGDAV